MQKEELDILIDKFSTGDTTDEEDLLIVQTLNASAELLEEFLKEIKIAKIKQDIQKMSKI